MTTELHDAARLVAKAKRAQDVFGESNSLHDLKRAYRRLALVLYPDRYTNEADRRVANDAFCLLSDFYQTALQHFGAGNAASDKSGQNGEGLLAAETKRGRHVLHKLLASGDLADLYMASSTFADGVQRQTVCKVARRATDNDLLQTEAAAIKQLRATGSDERRHVFVPELLDRFSVTEKGTSARRANVLAQLDGFYDLTQVRQAYPQGVRPIDMGWMWRRLLLVLGYAHRQGVVHGAVLPSHVMILPAQHGLVLVDWCYASVRPDKGKQPRLQAIVDASRDWYPAEVFAKQTPSAATDIAMAARCMIELMGGDPVTGNFAGDSRVGRPFRAYFKSCLAASQSARPDDAWQLLQEFDELLERLGSPYFPRRFRTFAMPTGVA